MDQKKKKRTGEYIHHAYSGCLQVSVCLMCALFLFTFLLNLFCDMWGENVEHVYNETEIISYTECWMEQIHIEMKH